LSREGQVDVDAIIM